MPDPGSHKYDIQRTRLRDEYDAGEAPDQNADRAANAELQRDNPPRPLGDPERAAGPQGTRGTSQGSPGIDDPPRPLSGEVELRSSAFNDHTLIPDRYSKGGDNISPPLEWGGIPDGTRELALLCEDPDAPGGTFVHWVVTGISPNSTGVREGESPAGTIGRNGFDELGWGGPQPPVGDDPHRYFFRLYALDQPLGLAEAPGAEQVHKTMEGHVLARGTHVGLFGR
jgi:Raf kinase inhibitor-like YbhB/YbcL family protein